MAPQATAEQAKNTAAWISMGLTLVAILAVLPNPIISTITTGIALIIASVAAFRGGYTHRLRQASYFALAVGIVSVIVLLLFIDTTT